MSDTANRRPITMESLNQFQASPYGNCGGQTGRQTSITTEETMAPERVEGLQKKGIFFDATTRRGSGLLIHEVSRSYKTTHHSR